MNLQTSNPQDNNVDRTDDLSGRAFILLAGAAMLVGLWLRLYMIQDQLLVNDEWHGLAFVSGKSFVEILTNFNRNANSIPMNLYRWALLQGPGWSELMLRLPSLVAGVAMLAVLPLLAAKAINRRTGIILAWLMAVSPFLIFYSRLSRAYSPAVFLAGIAFFSCYLWANSGKQRFVWLYGLAAVSGFYFHATSAVTVFGPIVMLFVCKAVFIWRKKDENLIKPMLSHIFSAGLAVGAVSAVLVLPAFFNNPWWLQTTREQDAVTLQTFLGFTGLFTGSANMYFRFAFIGLTVFGIIQLAHARRLLGMLMIPVIAAYFIGLLFARWETIHIPIEFTRFSITLFPLLLAAMAFGLEGLVRRTALLVVRRRKWAFGVEAAILGAVMLALLGAGPLKIVNASENSFINHSAFQESYKPLPKDRTYDSHVMPGIYMPRSRVSAFYDKLAQSPAKCVIEYPMFICDHFNFFYFFQQIHGKRVLVGYATTAGIYDWLHQDRVHEDSVSDHVLFQVSDPKKFRFRNMVNVLDEKQIQNSPADYIILHRNMIKEILPGLHHAWEKKMLPYPVRQVEKRCRRTLGPPVYEDSNIAVFSLAGR